MRLPSAADQQSGASGKDALALEQAAPIQHGHAVDLADRTSERDRARDAERDRARDMQRDLQRENLVVLLIEVKPILINLGIEFGEVLGVHSVICSQDHAKNRSPNLYALPISQ